MFKIYKNIFNPTYNFYNRGFKTLVEMQQNSCKKYPNRPLFGKYIYNPEWITYNQWNEQINNIRGLLQEMEVNSGDKVSIISNNNVEWAVSAYATYSTGGVFVPMYQNQLYKDWKYILEDSNSKVLICTNKSTYNECKNLLSINNLKYLVYFNNNEIEINFNQSVKNYQNKNNNLILPQESDLATIIYTSGTTGVPKGVELTHKNLVSNIKNIQGSFKDFSKICNENDRSISFLPWAHCYGQTCELHGLISTGSSLFLSKGVDKLVEEIAEIKPTLLFSVPALFNRIYDGINSGLSNNIIKKKLFEDALKTSKTIKFGKNNNKIDELKYKFYEKIIFNKIKDKLGGNLKLAFVGGAATPPEVIEFFENINIPIIEGYGLTETSPIITLGTIEYPDRKIGSVGKLLPDNNVIILNMDSNGIGEICVNGPSVMKCYHNKKSETEQVMTCINGKKYFKTGDMGYLDEENRLFITGRLKEQYKLENGKFVVPTIIEDAIILSSDIKQVMVYGENYPHNIALIVANEEKYNILHEKFNGNLEEINNYYIEEILLYSKKKNIKNYEIPKDVIILEEDFNVNNGLLTPKMSIKRNKVYEKYKDDIINKYNKIK